MKTPPIMGDSRKNLRTGLIEGLLATPYSVVSVPGGFLLAALLTQWFAVEKSAYGWIVSLPSWANALQVLALPAIARFASTKDLAIGMAWFNAGLWAMLVATLAYLPKADGRAAAWYFGIFFLLASTSAAFHIVGWTAWVRDWVPGRLRGAYFGKRNSLSAAATLGFLLVSMAWLEVSKNSIIPYVGILALVMACRVLGLLLLQGIRSTRDHHPAAASPLLRSIAECRAAPGLPSFLLFAAWASFWLGFAGPFVPVFTFEELRVDPGHFALLTALGTLTSMIGSVYWGRLADRAGAIPVIAIGTALWEIPNFLWAVLVPGNSWLLYPMFLWGGFFAVAFFMGSFNLLLDLVPEKSGLAAIGLHLAVTAVASAVAPVISGYLLEEFAVRRGGGISVYHLGFALKSAAFLAGLLFLLPIREPRRTRRQSLPGAFRAVRQTMVAQGLELFANLAPFRGSSRNRQ